MKGSQGNAAQVIEYKTIIVYYWRVQYRRRHAIGRVQPDGIWHEREKNYFNNVHVNDAIAKAKRQSGAYLFEYRPMRYSYSMRVAA